MEYSRGIHSPRKIWFSTAAMAASPTYPTRHVMRSWRSVFTMVVIAIVAGPAWNAVATTPTDFTSLTPAEFKLTASDTEFKLTADDGA